MRDRLRSGFDVLIHCRGGLGRAGTIVARLLVELGMRPDEAVRRENVILLGPPGVGKTHLSRSAPSTPARAGR